MANNKAREVRSGEFSELLGEGNPLLVDFYATWCGPCKVMEPIVERLAERFAGRAAVVKVNIDNSPDLAAAYGVRSVPTLLLLESGRVVERTVGTSSEQSLAVLIEKYAANSEAIDEATAA